MSAAVRAGYKLTEAGVIPVDWILVNIASVSDMITVGFVGSMAHLFTKLGVPLLRGQDVKPNRLNLSNTEFISIDTHKLWKKSALEAGDVVIVRVGASAGMACVIPKALGNANAASLVVVRPNTHKLSAVFLSQLINSRFGEKQIESLLVGGAQPVINTSTAANFKLALPPIAEQRAIATALSDVDALLAKLDALIAKKRDLKVATMQQLLTGQTRLPGFSGEWGKTLLVNCLQMPATYGIVTAGIFQTSGVPMIRGGDIKSGRILEDLPFVTPEKSQEYSRTIVKPGDVVISLVGYPGEAAIVDDRSDGANISRAVGLLRPQKSLSSSYLASYLNSPIGRKNFLTPSAGSAQLVVNLKDLNLLLLPLPAVEEQVAIATVLSDMDTELTALEARRGKTRALKQGMMQELLTGRIRLV